MTQICDNENLNSNSAFATKYIIQILESGRNT